MSRTADRQIITAVPHCCVWLTQAVEHCVVKVTDQECLGYARECVRLAEFSDNPELRKTLLHMAREWMAVAMHEERMPQPKSPLAV